MDCVIRVIEGPDKGAEIALPPGPTLIGRGGKARLRLTAPGVSYEHAVITRSGEEYVIENLSASGTFVDDAKVAGAVKLRPRGVIRLDGETVLRLDATGDNVASGQKTLLLGALVGVLLIGGVVLAFNPFKPARPADDWSKAYSALNAWLRLEVKGHRLPKGTDTIFAEAWKLEQAQDYMRSQGRWLRLRLMLDSAEEQMHLQELSLAHPVALNNLLNPLNKSEILSDDEAGAALVQFIIRRLKWSAKENQAGKK